jgi:hypothetical protein
VLAWELRAYGASPGGETGRRTGRAHTEKGLVVGTVWGRRGGRKVREMVVGRGGVPVPVDSLLTDVGIGSYPPR